METKLSEKEIAYMRKISGGGPWILRDGKPSPSTQSLIDRGYCKTSRGRSGPLGIYTGEVIIKVTEAGKACLPEPEPEKP